MNQAQGAIETARAAGADRYAPEEYRAAVGALEKSREMIGESLTLFPGTEEYETENFVVVSNIPRQQIGPYIASLDRM